MAFYFKSLVFTLHKKMKLWRESINISLMLHEPSFSFPIKFWGDTVLTATYFINRTLILILQNKSPYQVLFVSKPPYHHLRVFEYLCFVSTLKLA